MRPFWRHGRRLRARCSVWMKRSANNEMADLRETRRQFFGRAGTGIGAAALASLMASDAEAGGLPGLPHFKPTAKRVIYLHQSGAPSQIDLFDYKPKLAELHGTALPDSIRKGQRITSMTSGQSSFPV